MVPQKRQKLVSEAKGDDDEIEIARVSRGLKEAEERGEVIAL